MKLSKEAENWLRRQSDLETVSLSELLYRVVEEKSFSLSEELKEAFVGIAILRDELDKFILSASIGKYLIITVYFRPFDLIKITLPNFSVKSKKYTKSDLINKILNEEAYLNNKSKLAVNLLKKLPSKKISYYY